MCWGKRLFRGVASRLDPHTTVLSSFEPCALSSGRPLRSMLGITAGA